MMPDTLRIDIEAPADTGLSVWLACIQVAQRYVEEHPPNYARLALYTWGSSGKPRAQVWRTQGGRLRVQLMPREGDRD